MLNIPDLKKVYSRRAMDDFHQNPNHKLSTIVICLTKIIQNQSLTHCIDAQGFQMEIKKIEIDFTFFFDFQEEGASGGANPESNPDPSPS